jgi:hypothetical protein
VPVIPGNAPISIDLAFSVVARIRFSDTLIFPVVAVLSANQSWEIAANCHGGWVAQSVEQRTENPCVGGSIPPPATTFNSTQ